MRFLAVLFLGSLTSLASAFFGMGRHSGGHSPSRYRSPSLRQTTDRGLKLDKDGKKYLCKVSRGNNETVNVYFRESGNRYLDFGVSEGSWQSEVHCHNTDCKESSTIVDDVSKCPACPCEKAPGMLDDKNSYYQVPMEKKVQQVCKLASPDRPVDILMIGLGAGHFHRRVMERCPKGTRLRTIEYLKQVKDIAERFFGLSLSPGVSEVHVGDALKAVTELVQFKQKASQKDRKAQILGASGWDMVVVDCFNDDEIPESCKSKHFLSALQKTLKPNASILQHVYNSWVEDGVADPAQAAEYKYITANYAEVFGKQHMEISDIQDHTQENLIQVHPGKLV